MTIDPKALRGLLEKASKGEWNVSHNTFFDVLSIGAEDLVCNFFVLSEENHKYYPMDDCEANAELIASMHEALPELLHASYYYIEQMANQLRFLESEASND